MSGDLYRKVVRTVFQGTLIAYSALFTPNIREV